MGQLKPPEWMPPDVSAVWEELAPKVDADTAESALFAAYCGQIARLRDAQTRLAEEGTIIEDGKSNPIPHPALRIEREAQDEIRKFMGRFGENV